MLLSRWASTLFTNPSRWSFTSHPFRSGRMVPFSASIGDWVLKLPSKLVNEVVFVVVDVVVSGEDVIDDVCSAYQC